MRLRGPSRSWLLVVAAVLVLVAGGGAVLIGPIVAQLVRMGREIGQTRNRLIEKTNHSAILDGCREMLATAAGAEFASPALSDAHVPEVIRALRPHRIRVAKDHVRIEFGGGFFHQGFDAYSPGAGCPDYEPDRRGMMHRELVPGLGYYEEE